MYASCNVPPSLDYKREGKGLRRYRVLSRTKCCRTGNRASSPLSSFSVIVLCRLWKAASASWKVRVLPADAPFRAVCECGRARSRAYSLTGLPVVTLISNILVLFHYSNPRCEFCVRCACGLVVVSCCSSLYVRYSSI